MPRVLDLLPSSCGSAAKKLQHSPANPASLARLALQLHVVASYLKATRLFVGELLGDEMFWWQNDRKTNRLLLRRFFTNLPVC